MKHIVDIYSDEPFKGFWDRLKMFVSNVEVQDPMSEEEKDMIIAVCDGKREYSDDELEDIYNNNLTTINTGIHMEDHMLLNNFKAALKELDLTTKTD